MGRSGKDSGSLEQARNKAMRLLGVRNRSTSELKQRLTADGFTPGVVDQVVGRLSQAGLLDDHSFALERARAMGKGKGWGPRKLRADLRGRGVPDEMVEEAIGQAYGNHSCSQVMRRLVKKRFGDDALSRGADRKVRGKAQRYLLGKGFEPEQVLELFPV